MWGGIIFLVNWVLEDTYMYLYMRQLKVNLLHSIHKWCKLFGTACTKQWRTLKTKVVSLIEVKRFGRFKTRINIFCAAKRNVLAALFILTCSSSAH